MNSAELSRLAAELFSVMRHLKQEKRILLRNKTEMRVVALKEIMSIRTSGHTTFVYIKGKPEFQCCRTLDFFETELNDYNFCRVHNDTVVNLHEVENYFFADNLIKLKDGSSVNTSKEKGRKLAERLKKEFGQNT